ncbi:PepSY domain-containing protein [Alloacidobacterium dinghuense]|uniref:PepSY domain-containing protein n=1 Tax=Alloacidobacterium dinghuense TaxID=2763107 RepID=A0A7G8BDC7_9BACT|nr:PepSY-associated TM helix domain-containing protein [Alloacidobacterium dinghuense]QNI30547.1 PepSY domain-containing protein [Alloacidobacterium dinghuense]
MSLAVDERAQKTEGAFPWLSTFWHHPRKSWIRRALFQVHLWSGISVGIIATLVGISGSAIVYKNALDKILTPKLFQTASAEQRLSTDQLLAAAHAAHPGWSISYASIQQKYNAQPPEPWVFYLVPPERRTTRLTLAYFDPATGKELGTIGEASGIMNWLAELHFHLLGGPTGTIVNGIGAALLLLLCMTGIVLWWPGRHRLHSGFKIQWKARWLRLNWDIHSVFGFWCSIPLAIEAFTGVYYCFFVPMAAAMVFILGGDVHQWHEMSIPPRSTVIAGQASVPLEPLVQEALQRHPDCILRGLALPLSPSDPLSVQLDPPHAEDRGQYAQVVFDRYSGKVLSDVDSRNQSLAIRLVLFIRPLHFGTFAGHWSRIAWILVGLMPGVLFFTGFVMWWRRVPARLLRS